MNQPQTDSFSVSINNGQKVLSIKSNANLLAGFARNGIFLPSACGGNARCGYCKVKVVRGGGAPQPQEEHLLSDAEKNAGVRLACQTKVTGDLAVEIPQHFFSAKRFSGKCVQKTLLTHDIIKLTIELINPKTIEFTAGQYIQIKSGAYEGKDPVLREFSIASSPSRTSSIDLMIRKVPGGVFTPWAFDILKEGDPLSLSGPYGDFHASTTSAPMIFIAGGSGMAPIYSILQDMKEKGVSRKAQYFFGAVTSKDLFLLDELHQLEKDLPDFSFVPALSCVPPDPQWNGQCGLITDVVARNTGSCAGCEAYLCGSPGMINACIAVLTKAGMPASNIFYDKFA
jgi:Na+-transporting NADH:ubiquinone oxidoreductase subunit F